MSFYGAMAATAQRLMAQYGRQITVNRYSPTVNGSARTVTKGAATTTCTPYAVVLPASKGTIEAFDNMTEAGSLAGREVRYLKIEAVGLTFAPKFGDEASFDSATWLVLGGTPVNPAGTPLVYGIGVVKL